MRRCDGYSCIVILNAGHKVGFLKFNILKLCCLLRMNGGISTLGEKLLYSLVVMHVFALPNGS